MVLSYLLLLKFMKMNQVCFNRYLCTISVMPKTITDHYCDNKRCAIHKVSQLYYLIDNFCANMNMCSVHIG